MSSRTERFWTEDLRVSRPRGRLAIAALVWVAAAGWLFTVLGPRNEPANAAESSDSNGRPRKSLNPFAKTDKSGQKSWEDYHENKANKEAASGSSAAVAGLASEKEPGAMSKFSSAVKGMFKSKKNNADATASDDAPSDELKPPSPEFYVTTARVELAAGNVVGEEKMYKEALRLDAKYLPAQLGLARMYDRRGNLETAMQYYVQAVKDHPESPTAYNDLGLCCARQQRFKESLEALNRAIGLAPDRALYRNNIATVLVQSGQIDEAFRNLALVHDDATAHYNVGFLLTKVRQPDAALAQFQLALQANPTLEPAKIWVKTLTSRSGASAGPRGATPPRPGRQDAESPERIQPPSSGATPSPRPAGLRNAPRGGMKATKPSAAAGRPAAPRSNAAPPSDDASVAPPFEPENSRKSPRRASANPFPEDEEIAAPPVARGRSRALPAEDEVGEAPLQPQPLKSRPPAKKLDSPQRRPGKAAAPPSEQYDDEQIDADVAEEDEIRNEPSTEGEDEANADEDVELKLPDSRTGARRLQNNRRTTPVPGQPGDAERGEREAAADARPARRRPASRY